ncbi:MAG: AAA family ATPase [Parcubacteria group bacterium]|jgi:predicted kinase
MNRPFLLIIDGMTGVGKTTTSKILAEKITRMAIIGMDKVKRFISDFERGQRDNQIARDVVFVMAEKYFDHGISVIVEQPFRSDEDLKKFEDLARRCSFPVYKVQLFTTPETALKRIQNRQANLEDKLTEERISRNIGLFENRAHNGFVVVDTSNISSLEVANKIMDILNS